MRRTLVAIAFLAALPVLGQPVSERVRGLVRELNSTSFVERELAENELQFGDGVRLGELESELRRADLSQEQRLRLLKAASVRFASEPRGAMGIQLSNEVSELGLRINGPVEGFDSMGKLQVNDIISEIGGLAIRSQTDLQAAIVSRSPGEVVAVEVVRGAEKLRLDLRLGSWSDLSSPGGLPRPSLEAAWIYRSREYAGLDEPGVIDLDFDVEAWEQEASRQWTPEGGVRPGQALREQVVVGGEARARPGAMAGVRLDRPLAPSARGRASDFPPMLRQELTKAEIDIIATEERLRRLGVQLELYKQNGARPVQVQQIETQIEEYQSVLEDLRRRAERIRQELRGMGIQDP